MLRRAYCSLVGPDRAAALYLFCAVCIRLIFAFAAVGAFLREVNTVGLNFFLWAFICNVTALATLETGSFCLAAVHFILTWLVGLGIGPLLSRAFPLPVLLGVDVVEALR